jgi:uncharacterized protein YecT (DUF1311 family)
VGQFESGACAAFRALQLLSDSRLTEGHASNGSRDRRPHLDNWRIDKGMKLGAVGLVLFCAHASTAQEAGTCNGNTYEMQVCLSKIYQKSDAELNATYRTALKTLRDYRNPNLQTQNLQSAERRWMAYRDAQCKAQLELFEGGTAGLIDHLGCLIEMTRQRTAELKRVYLSPP